MIVCSCNVLSEAQVCKRTPSADELRLCLARLRSEMGSTSDPPTLVEAEIEAHYQECNSSRNERSAPSAPIWQRSK